jgi:transposase
MKDTELLQLALGLAPPWTVVSCHFDAEQRRLDIGLGFPRGSRFPCPSCGQGNCPVHDTEQKSWRHLNFFQHEAHLVARVPRIRCGRCGVLQVALPWARPGSGFTLLFEAFIMILAQAMPVKRIAELIGEHDTRLWRVLEHYVERAREQADYSALRHLGVDETASKRGHNYVSLFVDLEQARTVFVTEGKDASTIERFQADLLDHGGSPEAVEEVCCDMSPAFILGVESHLPEARLTFDKFHVLKLLNAAVDEVRRREQRERPELKRTRYLWLKNPERLTAQQRTILETLHPKSLNLKTVRAYRIRLAFQALWKQPPELAEAFLKKWYFWATHSRLEPIQQCAKTFKKHWQGILNWFQSLVNNGILEGINSLIQAAKARARGYRTVKNFITMIYLISGKLDFRLPT